MRDDAPKAEWMRRRTLADAVEIAPIGVDQYSDVRFLHVAGYRAALGDAGFEDAETFRQHVYSSNYIDGLASSDLIAARYGGQLIGTASWAPSDDDGRSARICALFVIPAFLRQGIGARLLSVAEERAARAGYRSSLARAKGTAVQFFQRAGYQIASLGAASPLLPGGAGPTTFLKKSLLTVDGQIKGHA